MRHFLQIANGVDPGPLLMAIARQPELWNSERVRRWHQRSNHRAADDIVLRYPVWDGQEDEVEFSRQVLSEVHCSNYMAMALLPQVRPIVFGVMARVEGEELGRVMVTRLAPGGVIPLHSDVIPEVEAAFPDRQHPARYYERFHVVLAASPGVVFGAGGEAVYMAPGTVWWFDNIAQHSVVNNSGDDRVHLIMDVRCCRI